MKLEFHKDNLGIFGKRIGAYLIDYFICSLIAIILTILFTFIVIGDLVFTIIITLITPIYYIFMFGQYSQTLGYRILKLKIQNEDGTQVGYKHVIYRFLWTLLSGIFLGIGYLWVLFNPKKQAVQDHFTKILVIEE